MSFRGSYDKKLDIQGERLLSVSASGDKKFVTTMRDMVMQNTTSKRIIKFADLEYHTQPGGFKSSFYNSPDLPDSQVALTNQNTSSPSPTPTGSRSTPIEMTEMDIAEQYAYKAKEIV
ncbi:hypothetical protein H9Q74_007032 [Fusarium xylarioides]|nr:hypothetical protein H9Q71_007514 [Fusarium xylarioides]KAG5822878.1 hypothetical protein H9Q74_007032 [Fusarium xylarioides]